nr:putative ATP-dependent RNA helicase DHX57 [Onthophagus taurus]
MNSEEAQIQSDFFLREIPNVKIAPPIVEYKKPNVKEELKCLQLSNESQEMIMDTLRYIHGEDFSLSNVTDYVDKGTKFMKKYHLQRGNLVIKGITHFSNANEPQNDADRFKMFAVMRLETYGFHKEHCLEAIEYFPEIEDALSALYYKYFNVNKNELEEFSEKELLELREDEKCVLESIYESDFKEKIKNEVWILSFKLDYLVSHFYPRKIVKKPVEVKKKEKCRNFLRTGQCKFGLKCRFSHEEEVREAPSLDGHLNDYSFDLEIRFPKNTKYPHEPPLIFLKTNLLMSELMNLHITKRLLEEASSLASGGMGSIYSIAELLKNEDEILSFLKTNEVKFVSPSTKLFSNQNDKVTSVKKSLYYKKGYTNKERKNFSLNQLLDDDEKIAKTFKSKNSDLKYMKMQDFRKTLPAWSMKSEIIETINNSKVVVISGETGCGKSTQVPQFLLDDWLGNFSKTKSGHREIICTQPRRISAIGVAERVAEERLEKIGNTIGYQIRLESKISNLTRLSFCTTGILLRRLEIDPLLANVSHVVVDEVHERSVESDFLLLVLKDLLKKRSDLKVILMSATLNAESFSNYFGDVPVFEIPGRTFPVEQYFLEDILDETNFLFEDNSAFMRQIDIDFTEIDAKIERSFQFQNFMPRDNVKDENLAIEQVFARYHEYSKSTCKNLFLMDHEKINLDLIEHILRWFVEGNHEHPRDGSILIFLPGINEITALYQELNVSDLFGHKNGNFLLVPLHSSLTSEEQALIFKKPKDGVRKIVISTNIAETSITIDDCIFVIDCGKMKEKHFDSNRNMESLETVWVTRANAQQRKGRAGRVKPGVSVHLFTQHRFKHHLLPQPIPEIHRIPLEQVILDIKVLQNFSERTVFQVLDNILDPPIKENIDSAIIRLKHVGALDQEDNLTPLGHHLASLPVDVKIGKLILYGAIFGCVDSALTMAAVLSSKTPFVTPFNKKNEADAKKREFSAGKSDQITALRAYKKWLSMHKKSRLSGQNFANENYMSIKTLLTIGDIKYQFLEFLVSIGFIPVDLRNRRKSGIDDVLGITGNEFNKNGDNTRLLSAILCAALYPNVCKVLTPGMSYVMSAAGAIPVQPDAKDLKFWTKTEQVFIHPSSIISKIGNFESPYLIFQEKFKTSKVFLRDCSMVPTLALVLFSGFDIEINVHNGMSFLVIEDGWITYRVEEHKIAEMVKMIRLELVSLLEEKIKDPLLNLMHHEKGSKIISVINHLIMNE